MMHLLIDTFVQILFPLRGERIPNLIDFSREFFPIAGWEKFVSTGQSLVTPRSMLIDTFIIFSFGFYLFSSLFHLYIYFCITLSLIVMLIVKHKCDDFILNQ